MLVHTVEKFGFAPMTPVDEVDGLLALRTRPVAAIYVLEFANGEYYVGQSTNWRARFRQHEREHGDVVAVGWKPVWYPAAARQRMPDEERQMIDAFRHTLRPTWY